MRAILFAVMIAAMAANAKPAKPAAEPKEPVPAAIKNVADICKPTGAFGRVFSRGYGHVDTTASDDWAPFEKLTIEAGAITAEASFRGSGDSIEADVANAEKFLKALDKAVEAKAKFKHREKNGNAMRYSDGKEKGDGVTLILKQEQEIIAAQCSGG